MFVQITWASMYFCITIHDHADEWRALKNVDHVLQVAHLILLFLSIIVDLSSNPFNNNKL